MKNILKKVLSLAIVLFSGCSCGVGGSENIGGEIDETQFTRIDENGMTRLTKWAEKSEDYESSLNEASPAYDANYVVRNKYARVDYIHTAVANYANVKPFDKNFQPYTFEEKSYKVNGVTYAEVLYTYEADDYQILVFAEIHGHLKDEKYGSYYLEKLKLVEGEKVIKDAFSYKDYEFEDVIKTSKKIAKEQPNGKFKNFEC